MHNVWGRQLSARAYINTAFYRGQTTFGNMGIKLLMGNNMGHYAGSAAAGPGPRIRNHRTSGGTWNVSAWIVTSA